MKSDSEYAITGVPKKQGLYDPAYEHDACGVGFVVNIKGERSHAIIRQAITVLVNLSILVRAGSMVLKAILS